MSDTATAPAVTDGAPDMTLSGALRATAELVDSLGFEIWNTARLARHISDADEFRQCAELLGLELEHNPGYVHARTRIGPVELDIQTDARDFLAGTMTAIDETAAPTDVATYLQVTAGKLRRLADEITEAPTATTLDRFVALDTLKKSAETIVNATKKQIGDRDNGVMAELMAEFAERGVSSERHAVSGRLAHINHRVFPGVVDGYERSYVAEVMRDVDELAVFVELGFNLNSVRNFFTERIKQLEAAGTPVTEDALARLIPEQLQGLLELKPSPVISVRS